MTFNFFDFAYAATHLGILPTTEEQLALEQQLTARFNTEAVIRGWPVRVEQFGPALPDLLYIWDKKLRKFVPAPRGVSPVLERWRNLATSPSPNIAFQMEIAPAVGEANIRRGAEAEGGNLRENGCWPRRVGSRTTIDRQGAGISCILRELSWKRPT